MKFIANFEDEKRAETEIFIMEGFCKNVSSNYNLPSGSNIKKCTNRAKFWHGVIIHCPCNKKETNNSQLVKDLSPIPRAKVYEKCVI